LRHSVNLRRVLFVLFVLLLLQFLPILLRHDLTDEVSSADAENDDGPKNQQEDTSAGATKDVPELAVSVTKEAHYFMPEIDDFGPECSEFLGCGRGVGGICLG
jgi:hypothetical protein